MNLGWPSETTKFPDVFGATTVLTPNTLQQYIIRSPTISTYSIILRKMCVE